MDRLPVVELDEGWRYFPTEDMDPAYGTSATDESSWGMSDRLSGLPADLVTFYGEIHVQRRFDVPPISDQCLRYLLHIDHAPRGTSITINGWHVGTTLADTPFVSDVTDYVTLEGNRLLLKITRKGSPSGIRLEGVLCAQASHGGAD